MTKKKKKPILYLLLLMFLLNINVAAMAQPAGDSSSSPAQPAQAVKSPFTDVTAGDSNLIFISYLAQRGLMKGFPDGGFHPGEGLTRAEAAAMFTRIAGLKTDTGATGFKDVAANHWAAGSIAAAVKAGYIKGFPDATFQPEKKLTRAEGISLFLQLSKEKADAALPSLQDISSQHWAAKSVAVALEAGMIGLSKDGKKFYPDQAFKRGDLTRALAILLTTEPELSKASLTTTLNVKNGEVKLIKNGAKDEQTVTGTLILNPGDSISTGKNAEAEVDFPDGSALLFKADSKFSLKTSQGRSYIKVDGSPGVAVDNVEVELKQGNLFGALATKAGSEPSLQQGSEQKKISLKDMSKVASLKDLGALLFAAADKSQPWYQTAEKKKVKMKVDMPWGVAAIRGSFWHNIVTATNNETTLLEGSAEIVAGGKTQALTPGNASAVAALGAAPTPPVPMNKEQAQAWVQQKDWVQTKAETIQQNQESATPSPQAADAKPGEAPAQVNQSQNTQNTSEAPTATSVVEAVSQALNQAATTSGSSTNTTGGTSASNTGTQTGNSSSPSNESSSSSSVAASLLPANTWKVADVVSTVYNGATYKLASDFTVGKPSDIQGSYYSLRLRDSDGIAHGANEWKLLTQKMRRPTLFFSDPSRVVVKFATDSAGQNPTGLYCLNSNGTLCDLMKTVQGTITLPTSYEAPAGGLQLQVIAKGVSGRGRIYEFSTKVTMPEGASSVDYKLKVLGVLPDSSDYQVLFRPVGTYSEPWMERQPVPVSCANLTTAPIDFEVFRGAWASGSVQLPAALPSGQTLAVTINYDCQNATSGHPIFSKDLTFDSSTTTIDYQLPVAPGDYKVYYVLHPTSDLYDYFVNNRILDCAYYRSGASSTAFDGDTLTVGSADVTGIDLNVPNDGCLVTGSIILPWEANDNVYFYVTCDSLPNYTGWAKISAGMLSADYILVVPAGTYANPFCFYHYGGYAYGELSVTTISGDLPGQNVYLYGTSKKALTATVHGNLNLPIIDPNSIWIGGTVFNLDSPDYTLDKMVEALTAVDKYYSSDDDELSSLDLYYKSSLPAWFNLNDSAIGNGSSLQSDSANAVDSADLPDLFGGYYPGKDGVGIYSEREGYYEPEGTNGQYLFALLPPDASITTKDYTTDGNVALSVNTTPYKLPQPLVGCSYAADSPGTASITITTTTTNTGYTSSSVDKTITVTAVPALGVYPYALDVGYPDTAVTIYDNASNLWSAGEALDIVLIGSEGPYAEISSDPTTTVNEDNITLILPAGQPECRFNISLAHKGAGVPFANARIYINQAGNNSVINPGSCYNKSTHILTIPVSGNEPYAPIDPTKLTISQGSIDCTLTGPYSPISNAETLAEGKVQHNSSNCCFEIWLTSTDAANMSSNFVAGPAKITAIDGWCIDASGNHAAAQASPVSMAIITN